MSDDPRLSQIAATVREQGSCRATLSPDEVEALEIEGLFVKVSSIASDQHGKRICVVSPKI